jgi:glutathione S-transferase
MAQSVEMSYFSGPAGAISWEKFAKPLFGMHTDSAAVDAAREKLEGHFDAIETVLGGQAWMGGEAFGLVDCWYIPFVQRLRECGEWEGLVEWKGGKRERVGAWWEKCLGVEGVKAYVEGMPTKESIRKKFAEEAKGA